MKKRLLAVAIIVTFLFGTLAYAQEYDAKIPAEEMQVIAAEDIGITPIQDIKEDDIEEDVLEESEEDYEEPEESESEDVQEEETEEPEDTEETVSPEPPAGMVEGYVEGTYFEQNTTDCETCEECYTCPENEHIYKHTVSWDEDTESYMLDEWCEICGHGTYTPITEEELETLGVETDVEF